MAIYTSVTDTQRAWQSSTDAWLSPLSTDRASARISCPDEHARIPSHLLL